MKLIIFYLSFTSFICFAQQKEEIVQTKILNNSSNLYIKSKYFEGVIFVHDNNDSLYWTPSVDEILLIESFIKKYLNEENPKTSYFSEINYSEISNYYRQYITRYYTNSNKKYIWITFLKKQIINKGEIDDWLEKPYQIIGGEPDYLSLEIDFEDILKNNFSKVY